MKHQTGLIDFEEDAPVQAFKPDRIPMFRNLFDFVIPGEDDAPEPESPDPED